MNHAKWMLSLVILSALPFFGTTAEAAEMKSLRIIATSDLHGKFVPWDYALDEESRSGSVAQLSSAVAQYRNENTLLVDGGDTIQDNEADIFAHSEGVHPMVQAVNALNYDVWVTGNHEYNYGMDVVKKTIADMQCAVLTGNVYDESGEPVADGYAIFDRDGVRVAVIGMVTPNIARWDPVNLAGCTVTDPLEETRKIIDAIHGQYDVLVGVFHMSLDNEYGVPNSGVTDILNACPEFDVMVSAHAHKQIAGEEINGVLVVQNKNMAQTMSVIDLELEQDDGGWKVVQKTSESIAIADYEPDPLIVQLLAEYDELAREEAEQVIGELAEGPLAEEDEIPGIAEGRIRDSAVIELINSVQMYYTGAEVSATALFSSQANIQPGKIRKCDASLIYKYTNTLYKLHMTGAQLRKYMEWSASYYNTFHPGDLTISFNENIPEYNYDMFDGVNYEINVANEPGSRIENLTWPDGTPVEDEDEFDIAVNNYRAGAHLLVPGEIYTEDDLPELVEMDVRGDIGGIRELIGDYIRNVKHGVITPECDNNWKLTGYEWDEAQHAEAAEKVASGELEIPVSEDGRSENIKPITADDLK